MANVLKRLMERVFGKEGKKKPPTRKRYIVRG